MRIEETEEYKEFMLHVEAYTSICRRFITDGGSKKTYHDLPLNSMTGNMLGTGHFDGSLNEFTHACFSMPDKRWPVMAECAKLPLSYFESRLMSSLGAEDYEHAAVLRDIIDNYDTHPALKTNQDG